MKHQNITLRNALKNAPAFTFYQVVMLSKIQTTTEYHLNFKGSLHSGFENAPRAQQTKTNIYNTAPVPMKTGFSPFVCEEILFPVTFSNHTFSIPLHSHSCIAALFTDYNLQIKSNSTATCWVRSCKCVTLKVLLGVNAPSHYST